VVVGVILAAGKSTRFGTDKRKSILPNGRSVLEQTISNARASLDQILVVLRATDQQFADELATRFNDPAISYFLAPDSADGMAHSLANAINHLVVEEYSVEGSMIFLGDMPYLNTATISLLLTAFNKHKSNAPIVVPTILKTDSGGSATTVPGHPVIFSSTYFPELAKLTGDTGAKKVIGANSAKVVRVSVEDAGVLKDVDKPSDIEAT